MLNPQSYQQRATPQFIGARAELPTKSIRAFLPHEEPAGSPMYYRIRLPEAPQKQSIECVSVGLSSGLDANVTVASLVLEPSRTRVMKFKSLDLIRAAIVIYAFSQGLTVGGVSGAQQTAGLMKGMIG